MADDRGYIGVTAPGLDENAPLLIALASPSRGHSLQRYDDSSDESDDEQDVPGSRRKVATSGAVSMLSLTSTPASRSAGLCGKIPCFASCLQQA